MSPAKVAGDIVGALKGHPSMLFVVVMVLALNGAFLGLTYYAANVRQERAHAEYMALLKNCFPKGEP